MVSYRYRLLDYASQAVQRAAHGITGVRKIISSERIVKHSRRTKLPKRGEKSPPARHREASPSEGVKSIQYWSVKRAVLVARVTSTGSSCDQYWLLSPYRESPSDSCATPLPLHYTTPLFISIGFADEARQVKAQTTTGLHMEQLLVSGSNHYSFRMRTTTR